MGWKGRIILYKVGIALTPTRFVVLLSFIDTLKSNVERLRNRDQNVVCKLHLGGGVFASLRNDFHVVNIRKFFQPQGGIVPHTTKKGDRTTSKRVEHSGSAAGRYQQTDQYRREAVLRKIRPRRSNNQVQLQGV